MSITNLDLKKSPKDKEISPKKELETTSFEDNSPLDLSKLDPVTKKTLEELLLIWRQTKNPNAFLFACHILKYPHFLHDTVTRSSKVRINSQLKKSLLDRLVGKLMNNSHLTTGMKVKTLRLVKTALGKKVTADTTISSYLLLCLVKSAPQGDARKQKYGSGHLTRAVQLTLTRKITWFLQTIFDYVQAKGPKNSTIKLLEQEFSDLDSNSSRSALLSKKRECEQNAIRSNIQ